jgi:hypothetical protein
MTEKNHDWNKTLGMIRAQHLEFLKNAGEEEKEKEKKKKSVKMNQCKPFTLRI